MRSGRVTALSLMLYAQQLRGCPEEDRAIRRREGGQGADDRAGWRLGAGRVRESLV